MLLVEGAARPAASGKKLDPRSISLLLISISVCMASPLWTKLCLARIELLCQMRPTPRQAIPGRFTFAAVGDFGHALTLGSEF